MEQSSQTVVKLAAMECAASCLLTLLRMKQVSSQYFLINYWSLNYSSGLLMSGKNIRLYRLDYLYGIQSELKKGTEDDLVRFIHEGGAALLMCRAADLDYFPRELLTHEENGIQHFSLIYGCDASGSQFQVADPTADYIGTLSREQLGRSRMKGKDSPLYYYTLVPPKQFVLPDPKEAFQFTSKQNLQLYTKGDHNFGYRAVERYAADLMQSIHWTKERRNLWIYQNNITISSIIKTRSAVWNSICELQLLSSSQLEEGNLAIDRLIKLWTTVNFLLIKYKKRYTDMALLSQLKDKLMEVGRQETQFLLQMEQVGSELS
ncbi:hypothetical protein MNQ98_02450 [Paenibacillus sp. N3/727]|uniref:hypothetical protein n=1 Tax=Paenibacillus sp. N3/727 TaxID=2925845 RepID=UPI001F53BBFE|nr:hypothetical protein [Paenibacillus sp. N3/727]UNK18928.1 hypothetical protein MNQ98_02450 [Paenibacillus sp. N3/727]